MSQTEVQLTIGGDEVHPDGKGAPPSIDLIDRDPHDMNSHVKVTFDEIFAEPHPSVFSFDPVWTTSFKVFRNTKLWCYRISTLLCAVPAAFVWGIYFAWMACCTIWCCRPCIKAYEIQMFCIKGYLVAFLDACVRPCYETFGYIFYNIRVKVHNNKSEA